MSKKPFVILCEDANLKYRSGYLKAVNHRRIIRSRWIDSARGFASAAEAQALIDEVKHQLIRLDLSIINRDEINQSINKGKEETNAK